MINNKYERSSKAKVLSKVLMFTRDRKRVFVIPELRKYIWLSGGEWFTIKMSEKPYVEREMAERWFNYVIDEYGVDFLEKVIVVSRRVFVYRYYKEVTIKVYRVNEFQKNRIAAEFGGLVKRIDKYQITIVTTFKNVAEVVEKLYEIIGEENESCDNDV